MGQETPPTPPPPPGPPPPKNPGFVTLVNWLYGYFVVPESLAPEHRRHFALSRANPVAVFHGLGRYPVVVGMAGVLFFVNLAQFGLHTVWVLYTAHR